MHAIPWGNQNTWVNHALSRKQQYNFPAIHSWVALEQDLQKLQMLCPGILMLLVKAGNLFVLIAKDNQLAAMLHYWYPTVNSWHMKHLSTSPKEGFISKNMKNRISFLQAQDSSAYLHMTLNIYGGQSWKAVWELCQGFFKLGSILQSHKRVKQSEGERGLLRMIIKWESLELTI